MPENPDVAVIVYGRGSRKKEIEYPLDAITHIQVCMAGAKLGNSHRQGPRPLGKIFPFNEIEPHLNRHTLKRRVETGRLKPRTEEDFNNQNEYYEENGTWDFINHKIPTLPPKMSVPIRESATVSVAGVPDDVKKILKAEQEVRPDKPEKAEKVDLPNFKKMKKVKLQEWCAEHDIEFEKSDGRDTLIQMIEEYLEDNEDAE